MGMRILCAGDSLTYGTGSTPGNTYPDALQTYLSDRLPGIRVIGDGKPGYSTKDYCEYVQSLDSSAGSAGAGFAGYRCYDAVVILLGCNDCRLDNWVETVESIGYLRKVTNHFLPYVKEDAKRMFLCSTLPLADPMPTGILGGQHPWRQSKVEEEMNPGILALAGSEGFGYIDVHSAFQAGLAKGQNLYDGIHPFDSGYRLIAETVGRAVVEVL